MPGNIESIDVFMASAGLISIKLDRYPLSLIYEKVLSHFLKFRLEVIITKVSNSQLCNYKVSTQEWYLTFPANYDIIEKEYDFYVWLLNDVWH